MYIVVFITSANRQEAEKIAQALLENKLAACVNIADNVSSYFWWENKIDTAQENLLIIKTRKTLFSKLVKTVRSLHSYTVPEVIAMPIIAGNKEYLDWIGDSVI